MSQFDTHAYFEKEIRDKMKLAVNGKYVYSKVTSMQHMEEVIDEFRYHTAFFAVDDTEDGFTFQTGGGYGSQNHCCVYPKTISFW